jgi:hypothetical protein
MSSAPVLHVLDKEDYAKHRLVCLPSDPMPPLAPSSLRIQSKVLGLTTNNLTYAKLGFLMGWWDIYPLPSNTPEPYKDSSKYGRISSWGYADILDSTVDGIPAGKSIFGYLPISNLPEDVVVEQTGLKDQIIVTSPHRQSVWKIYNRYRIMAPLAELEATKSADFLGWDALVQPLFSTAYYLSACGFAWDEKNLIHPSGNGEWTLEDANLDNSIVICLSASGKTGLSFAHQLRHNRPTKHQPQTIIGVGSQASKATTEKSGFYDKVLLYNDAEAAKIFIESNAPRRIVLIDFGARTGATQLWNDTLSSLSVPSIFVGVGGETKPMKPEDIMKMRNSFPNRIQTNANELREKGIAVGGDKNLEEFYEKCDEFKAAGGIPGMELKWGEGMEAWKEAWERLCKDDVRADEGLVFRL